MKKKVLIGIGIFILLAGAGMMYMNHQNRTKSPPGKAEYEKNGLKIEIDYSRPSVRGRLIFGTKEKEALQPYGEYWRLGANEATEITLNKDVLFGGKSLAAGQYRLYAVPGKDEFKIGVNTQLGKWGYSEPDYEKDIFTFMAPVEYGDEPVEQYTIDITEGQGGQVNVNFMWNYVKFSIPIIAE